MNKKLFLVAGMSRGGTNLLWNIIQSHPEVIDSYYEFNEIFGGKTGIKFIEKIQIELDALINTQMPQTKIIVSDRLLKFSKKSFAEDNFNREKYPGINYKDEDFETLNICTKLVSSWETDFFRKLLRRNDALKYIPILKRTFPDIKIIFILRNGLAVAEGWGRRGADIKTAAYWYAKYVKFYERYSESNPDCSMIVRFEDLLLDPFSVSEKIYQMLHLKETHLNQLRIAIKPTVSANHNVVNTTEKIKVWINYDNWKDFLDTSINESQIKKLNIKDKEYFRKINHHIMDKYGYL